MSHEIETINGESLAVFARQPAWHRLGTVLDYAPSVDEAIRVAKLGGWNVRTSSSLTAYEEDGSFVEVGNRRAVLRTNPVSGATEALGVVGPNYRVIQNEEAFAFAQNIVDDSDATVEAAGSLRGGKNVWMLLHLPESIEVGGFDAVRPYLLVTTGHDGGSALVAQLETIRVVCANTLGAAMEAARSRYVVHHSSTSEARIGEARAAIGVAFRQVEAFRAEADRLLDLPVTDGVVDELLRELFPTEDVDLAPAAITRRLAARDAIAEIYAGPTTDKIRGTAWGLWNATVEYADFGAGPREDAGLVKAAGKGVGEWGQRFKADALSTLGRILVDA